MASPRLVDVAPDFTQESSAGEIRFHQWLGESWGLLFSHSAQLASARAHESGLTEAMHAEFARRNVKLIALSQRPNGMQPARLEDVGAQHRARPAVPIIEDADGKVARLYGFLRADAGSRDEVGSLFVIDPSRKVRLILTFPASRGCNFGEVLRVLDSLRPVEYRSAA